MAPENAIEWAPCNQCLRRTKHDVIAVCVSSESEELIEDCFVEFETTSTMLECRGCGSVTLRKRVVCDEIGSDSTNYYPPPISRQAPVWSHDLPREMKSLLNEIYAALHANSRRLALMGTRSLVDLFMNTTIGDVGGFQEKLQKLSDDGHLSKRNRETLEAVLDAGHAATHRAHEPTKDDLTLIIDIVENLIQPFALKKKVAGLKKNTPKRKG